MNSQIIRGQVQHKRLAPAQHEFFYPVYMYLLNLDEIKDLDKEVRFFGYNRFNAVSVHDADYMKNTAGSIKDKVLGILKKEGIREEAVEIRMATAARYFNYVFNPVTFYFCFRADKSLLCIVAEVNNTFKEKHVYVMADPLEAPKGYKYRFRTSKRFHVSPFFDVSGEYEFLLKEIDDRFDVYVNYYRDGSLALTTHLTGDYVPLNSSNLLRTLFFRPLQASKTMPRILYQASILFFLKHMKYHDKPEPADRNTLRGEPPWPWERLFMRLVLRFFPQLKEGSLDFVLPDGRALRYGRKTGAADEQIIIKHYGFFTRILFGTDIGFGESYVEGDWSTPDLAGLLKLLSRNIGQINRLCKFMPRWKKIFDIAGHRKRKNTTANAAENISSHYDTSEAFFRQILDQNMVYSCAFFRDGSESLEKAQINKIDMMIEKAGIRPGDHLLEIGSGWGAFAINAALKTGCRVTTTTISQNQLEYVKKLVAEAGLSDKVTVIKEDYRHITGTFDNIVSIEMLEAVGHEFYGEYFKKCNELLKPGGRAVFQVITIPDERYGGHRKKIDWIQKYIFPGGLLPSLGELKKNIKAHTQMTVAGIESIGHPHYTGTLSIWRKNLILHRDKIKLLGFTEADLRKWEYYFAYCEAGFANKMIDDLQIILQK